MSSNPTRVVYILGDSHSGSTVLSLILAMHDAIEGPGEVRRLFRAWRVGIYCTCGQLVSECAFWSTVLREWLQASGLDSVGTYEQLRKRIESLRRLPMAVVRRRRPPSEARGYLETTTRLFDTIAAASGRPIVVDASKRAERACMLARAPELDVRLLHLVRDPRGVCFSMAQSRQKDLEAGVERNRTPQPVRRTAMLWVLRNLVAAWVRRRHDPARSVLVRYEDLVVDLPGTLGRIAPVVGVDLGEVARRVTRGETIQPRHVATGNRMRMTKEIHLRLDDEWARAMRADDRRLVEVLTGPWRRAYGYR